MKKLNTIQSLLDGTEKVLPSAVLASREVVLKSITATYMEGVKIKTVSAKAGGREDYNVTVKFHGVEEQSPLLIKKTPVRVRCSCPAFYYYFMEANKVNDALALGRFTKYVPKEGGGKKKRKPNNPKKIPGLCKHLTALMAAMDDNRFIN